MIWKFHSTLSIQSHFWSILTALCSFRRHPSPAYAYLLFRYSVSRFTVSFRREMKRIDRDHFSMEVTNRPLLPQKYALLATASNAMIDGRAFLVKHNFKIIKIRFFSKSFPNKNFPNEERFCFLFRRWSQVPSSFAKILKLNNSDNRSQSHMIFRFYSTLRNFFQIRLIQRLHTYRESLMDERDLWAVFLHEVVL